MSLEYKFLNYQSIPDLYRAFMEAFSDYAMDASHITEDSLYKRGIKNGIDFESSVGVFEDAKMVGFTMVGIDDWNGGLSAFDIATGIIKSYRGKGIAREMFNFALPRLREKGVKKFYLEVLRENEPAIKAYKKTGFHITREFDCYSLDIPKVNLVKKCSINLQIEQISQSDIHKFAGFLDWVPSWENSLNSIKRMPDKMMIFKGVQDGSDTGFIAYSPTMNWILNLAVDKNFRRNGIGTALLKHLLSLLPLEQDVIRLINVQNDDNAIIRFFEDLGFTIYARQYEMVFEL